jgi:ATP-dependent Clp protease ATP-binding subunit ClpA
MALPPDLALLLDYARAEAKRLGHGQVVLAHVAAALARRNATLFGSTFGADAAARLDALLKRVPTATTVLVDSAELGELLARVAAVPDPADALNEEIRKLLAGDETGRRPARIHRAELLQQLKARIVGQDEALETIVSRLALTRMQFDLRPRRPDGVFLLAGPSGTGKSALAIALAESLFGGEGHFIRLDMSEYAHDWAVSRLIGPQPGYVGSDKPEGWLTTRVRQQPDSLVLLDEIEKSHPTVWNTFLQIFDDGRLTDGQGKEADFSRTVILMTSNLGSESFRRKRPIGFRNDDEAADIRSERTEDAVKEAMPPELVNRLDAVIVFDALTPAAVREIASREIAAALDRLRGRGYDAEVPADVVSFVAEQGYDPAYGARHLHRNIERHLLETLVDHPPSKLRAALSGGSVAWVPA